MAESSNSTEAPKSAGPSKSTMTYSMDPILYLYTSLTAGSSHIITATSRMETILKANRIPFKGVDTATDEKARMLWGRRAGKDGSGRVRKIPGLVQMGMVIGDIVEVEDWNEYGELKQHVKIVPLNPDGTIAPKKAAATKKTAAKAKVSATSVATKSGLNVDAVSSSTALPMRGIAEQAAQRAKDIKKQPVKAKSTAKADSQSVTMMQSPIDSTWSIAVEPFESETGSTKESFSTPTPQPSASGSTSTRRSLMFEPSKKEVQIEDVVESMGSLSSIQSPNSTAWKPLDMPTMGGFPSSFDVVRSGAASTNAQDPVTVHGNASLEEVSMEDLMAGDSSHETNKGIESVANPVDE